MTIRTITLSSLKKVKNSVIGNPSAKLQYAQDEVFIQTLVECLNHPPPISDPQGSGDDIRVEAAHVISSITYGSEEALGRLLRADALRAFLFAISKFQSTDPITLKSAFARALRALTVAISDVVGPSLWGLRSDTSTIRREARAALDYLFHLESLDIFLPLLVDTSTQTSTSIAQLLASAVRTPEHRKSITDWLPPSDRGKEIRTKRGWEKTATTNVNAPSRQGGWVARHLTVFIHHRDIKLQEAALSALAALAKDNSPVATVLSKTSPDRSDVSSVLSGILSVTKSKSPDVQLAACLCATHIIRASSNGHPVSVDDWAARTIMNVVNRMISTSTTETPQNRTKACFILYYLVTDDMGLSHLVYERGSLEKLANLVPSINPPDSDQDTESEEPESISCQREAALTAIAAISLFDNDVRHAVAGDLRLIPTIYACLSHRHVGVRYAACQCVRALSRAVAVLRTNMVDTGLGMAVFQIFKKEDEDRRVLLAALRAVCNIVNEFSPLRPIFLEKGLMPRLVQLIEGEESTLRLSALWAVKNLLRKTSLETKRDVMKQLRWKQLAELLDDPDDEVLEQALNIVRNIGEDESGIDITFQELGSDLLLNRVTMSLGSSDDNVVLQAAFVLANLANGHESHQDLIMSHPKLLASLRNCLAESKAEARRPAVACVLELVRNNPKRRKDIIDAGIVSTLRHICEWSGGLSMSPGGRSLQHHQSGALEDDRDTIDNARVALDWLEHGDIF